MIQQYTVDGQLVTTHGRRGSNIGELQWPLLTGSDEFNNILIVDQEVDELQNPLLTGSDEFNNILIAGDHNHRIEILKTDGQFQSLPVTGVAQHPACARVYMGRLYVIAYHADKLQVFAIE